MPSNLVPNVFIHGACDNNDFLEETIDRKNTTHITTMVVFQQRLEKETPLNFVTVCKDNNMMLPDELLNCQVIKKYIPPSKKPELPACLKQEPSPLNSSDSDMACNKDLLWLLSRLQFQVEHIPNVSFKHCSQQVPGWTGFNQLSSTAELPVSNVMFLPMIPAPPNRYDVVYSCMKNIIDLSLQNNQINAVLSCDEDVYRIGKQIQLNRPDEFQDLVLRLGGFHIVKAYLVVLGKYIAGSGVEDLLEESGCYGCNTIDSIIAGKHYNRGVHTHKILMEALWRCIIKVFITKGDNGDLTPHVDTLLEKICKLQEHILSRNVKAVQHSVIDSLEEMKGFKTSLEILISKGSERSENFKYWSNYINMVFIMLQFIRSEREGNWDLYMYSLQKMIPLFFAFDQPNYARHTSVYIEDMMALPENSPYVYAEFKKGNFGVKRTEGSFCQVPPDQALEQTINKSSKISGGVIGFSAKTKAVSTWQLTYHEKNSMAKCLEEFCKSDDDGWGESCPNIKEFSEHRLKKDERDVTAIIECLEKWSNPFDCYTTDCETNLCNIVTNVIASDEIRNDLLPVLEIGETNYKHFKQTCIREQTRSWNEPIKRNKLKTFKNMQVSKGDIKKGKPQLGEGYMAAFNKSILLAHERGYPLHKLFEFELLPYPPGLIYPDGSLKKAIKSELLHAIEKIMNGEIINYLPAFPNKNTTWIIDGMAAVHRVKVATCKTFGDLSNLIFDTVTKKPLRNSDTSRIDIVFDRYEEESIKRGERQRRNKNSKPFEVGHILSSTILPVQWNNFMSTGSNKQKLTNFLSEDWCKSKKILDYDQKIILGGGFDTSTKTVALYKNGFERLEDLQSSQEEADTRIFMHALHAVTQDFATQVVIWSPDTDVFVLAMYFFKQLQESGLKEMWFKTGVGEKTCFIPVHEAVKSVGNKVCNVLPALHALTGCDSTSKLGGKGGALKLLMKTEDLSFLETYGTIPIKVDVIEQTEIFITQLISPKNNKCNLNELRYQFYHHRVSARNSVSRLPPTSNSFIQHVLRANYQVHVWKQALEMKPWIESPIDQGYHMQNDLLTFTLMTNPAIPEDLKDGCRCQKCAKFTNCLCYKNNLKCCGFCKCSINSCKNPLNQLEYTDL